jgi:hypothetical protein
MLFQNVSSNATIKTFNELSPQSDLLKTDLTQFSKNEFRAFGGIGPNFDLVIFFRKKQDRADSKRLNPELKVGVSYSYNEILGLSYHQQNTFRVDTLSSSQNNQNIFVDSIVTDNLAAGYNQNIIYFTAGLNFNSTSSKKLGYYFGGELGLGYSVNSKTQISIYSENRITNSDEKSKSTNDIDDLKNEFIDNKNGFILRLGVPIGLTTRLGNEFREADESSFSQIFIETRPVLSYHLIPETDAELIVSIILGVGYRYNF